MIPYYTSIERTGKPMIRVEEALTRILNTFSPLGLEKVSILDALERVLGEDITAPRNIPPKDNSAMDGYALRWQDTRGASPDAPVTLEVTEDIPAGQIPRIKSARERPPAS